MIHNNKPNVKLTIYTATGLEFTLFDCIDWNSSNPLDSATATASLEFRGLRPIGVDKRSLRAQKFDDLVDSWDVARVQIDDSSPPSNVRGRTWTDTFGFINDCGESIGVDGDGRPEKRYRFEIVSLGHALERYQLFWHSHLEGRSNPFGVGALAKLKGNPPNGRPDEVLSQFYGAFINDEYLMQLADGRKLNEAIFLQFEEIKEALATIALSSLGMQQSLWETLKAHCDSPWSELFVDIPHEQAYNVANQQIYQNRGRGYGHNITMYLRKTPFDREDWDRLAEEPGWGFTFNNGDLWGPGNLTRRNAGQVYTMFWAPGKAYFGTYDQLSVIYEASGGKAPRYSVGDIKKFGLRMLQMQTEYVQFTKGKSDLSISPEQRQRMKLDPSLNAMWQLIANRTEQLHRWFGYPKYYEGPIYLRGRIGASKEHGIRKGGVLTHEETGRQFYIEDVDQQWSGPDGPWVTTVHVKRGHDPQHYAKWWQLKTAELDASGPFVNVGIA